MTTIRRKLSVISGKIENPDNLLGEMQKEAQSWLNSISGNKNPRDMRHTPPPQNTQKAPNVHEAQDNSQHSSGRSVCATSLPQKIPDSIPDENQAPFDETEPNHRDNREFPIFTTPSPESTGKQKEKHIRGEDEGDDIDVKPAVSEIIELLRHQLPRKFMESDFTEHTIKLGLTEDEARKLFWRLRDDGRILRDLEDHWQWV